jgi:hypothetical protein
VSVHTDSKFVETGMPFVDENYLYPDDLTAIVQLRGADAPNRHQGRPDRERSATHDAVA